MHPPKTISNVPNTILDAARCVASTPSRESSWPKKTSSAIAANDEPIELGPKQIACRTVLVTLLIVLVDQEDWARLCLLLYRTNLSLSRSPVRGSARVLFFDAPYDGAQLLPCASVIVHW